MQMVEIFYSISEIEKIFKGNRICVEAAMAIVDMFWAVLCHYWVAVQESKTEAKFLKLIKNNICIILNKLLIKEVPVFKASTDTEKLCSGISAYAWGGINGLSQRQTEMAGTKPSPVLAYMQIMH